LLTLTVLQCHCVAYSDEDDEDNKALLYLPISPEIEDVEESHAADQQVTNDFSTLVMFRVRHSNAKCVIVTDACVVMHSPTIARISV